MTVGRVIDQAKSEIADVLEYRGTVAALLRRVAVRQQQLFSEAAKADPDWSLASAVATVQQGRFSLESLVGPDGNAVPLPRLERIVMIEVEDSGASKWGPGTEITVVPRDDRSSGLPPRVFAMGRELREVDGELGGVDHVRVHYSRRPKVSLSLQDELEIPDPHSYLFVYDLARFMLRRAGRTGGEPGASVDEELEKEESAAEKAFAEYIAGVTGTTRRFH